MLWRQARGAELVVLESQDSGKTISMAGKVDIPRGMWLRLCLRGLSYNCGCSCSCVSRLCLIAHYVAGVAVAAQP